MGLDRQGLRHAHGGPEVRAREGGAAAQPVPDQPVEDHRRPVGSPADRAGRPLQPPRLGQPGVVKARLRRHWPVRGREGNTDPGAARAHVRRSRSPSRPRRVFSGRARRTGATTGSSPTRSSRAGSTPATSSSRCRTSPGGATGRSAPRSTASREDECVCVLELETEGALKVQEEVAAARDDLRRGAVDELERRLRERATESAGEIGERIDLAREPARARARVRSHGAKRRDRTRRRTSSRRSSSASWRAQVPWRGHDLSTHRRPARTGRRSRYALVIVAAKRARQINNYHHQLGEGTLRRSAAAARRVSLEELPDDGNRGDRERQDRVRARGRRARGSGAGAWRASCSV